MELLRGRRESLGTRLGKRVFQKEDGIMSREVLEPVTHSLQHGGLCTEDVSDG